MDKKGYDEYFLMLVPNNEFCKKSLARWKLMYICTLYMYMYGKVHVHVDTITLYMYMYM